MPHDQNGDLLAIGDRVVAHGTVKDVNASESGCNVEVKLDAPEGEYSPTVTCNMRSFTKAHEVPEIELGPALGEEVVDVATGFEGVVTARCECLLGSIDLQVTPKVGGEHSDARWIAAGRLKAKEGLAF